VGDEHEVDVHAPEDLVHRGDVRGLDSIQENTTGSCNSPSNPAGSKAGTVWFDGSKLILWKKAHF
jgi:hypothetical protein